VQRIHCETWTTKVVCKKLQIQENSQPIAKLMHYFKKAASGGPCKEGRSSMTQETIPFRDWDSRQTVVFPGTSSAAWCFGWSALRTAVYNNIIIITIVLSSSSSPATVVRWLACWTQAQKARVQIAVATLSGNSLRQTAHTHRASVHQAAKLVAALLRLAG